MIVDILTCSKLQPQRQKRMTLLFRKSELNQIPVTLKEKADANLPNNWLFRFVHDQSEEESLIYLTDQATDEQQERFNLFNLTEGTDLTFTYNGDYHYFVYQMPDGGSEDYSTGLLVEQGIAKVIGTASSVPSFEPTTSKAVYNG